MIELRQIEKVEDIPTVISALSELMSLIFWDSAIATVDDETDAAVC